MDEHSNTLQDEAKGIRRGSPFAPDTARQAPEGTEVPVVFSPSIAAEGTVLVGPQLESSLDVGVAAETALGGLLAAWLILPIALFAAFWFPFGGVLIAALGTILGVVALASPRYWMASVVLLLHLAVAALAYYDWIR